MADDLTRPFIGYRSAGRRPESQQGRRASADAPLAALRGILSGVLGAPGDIESLVRMLPGLSERTVLPTSEDVERRLPLRSVSQTPVGRAATGLSQLGGGFYTGPGSPLRALAAVPGALKHGAGEFMRAAGQPAVNVIKPKGGNWLAGSVEEAIEPMRVRVVGSDPAARLRDLDAAYAQNVEAGVAMDPAVFARERARLEPEAAINRWLEQKLAKYIRNEMGTPEDPVRALAERGKLHYTPRERSLEDLDHLYDIRKEAGMPTESVAKTDPGAAWEEVADLVIGAPGQGKYGREFGGDMGEINELGFPHLVDELRNAINPESGLPQNLMWKYADLDKVTVPQAVQRVHDINEWRAAQKAEADAARAMNPATHVFKEYPDQGFKWVELRQPKELPEGWTEKNGAYYDPKGERHVHPGTESLADALKYEGETMGHCVGGYCPDVVEGKSRIYSLRDKKGQPHVTIEVAPRPLKTWDDVTAAVGKEQAAKLWQEFDDIGGNNMSDVGEGFDIFIKNKGIQPAQDIVQIKGKANRAPKEEYLPAVQDFVRSQQWGKIGDLQNTGLFQLPDKRLITKEQFDEGIQRLTGEGEPSVNAEWFQRQIKRDPSWWDQASGAFEGFARGGAVRGYAAGGAVSGPIPYDAAKIDELAAALIV